MMDIFEKNILRKGKLREISGYRQYAQCEISKNQLDNHFGKGGRRDWLSEFVSGDKRL